jgi:hypothetical protein
MAVFKGILKLHISTWNEALRRDGHQALPVCYQVGQKFTNSKRKCGKQEGTPSISLSKSTLNTIVLTPVCHTAVTPCHQRLTMKSQQFLDQLKNPIVGE